MRLGEEVALDHGEPASLDGNVDVTALSHELALVVVEPERYCDARLVAVDHHVVIAQGGAAVALGAELGHRACDKAHASGGVERHATHHAVAVGQEAGVGYEEAQADGLDEELVVVGSDKLYLAHDGLERDVAVDNGGGVALIDLEVDGCDARVSVARWVVAIVTASEGHVAQVGGEIVQIGTGLCRVDIVAPCHESVFVGWQREPEGGGQSLARLENVGLAGDDVVVARERLELATQQGSARRARVDNVVLPVGHGGVDVDSHDYWRRAKLGLALAVAACARDEDKDCC